MQNINSENVLKLIETFSDEYNFYLVMELCESNLY